MNFDAVRELNGRIERKCVFQNGSGSILEWKRFIEWKNRMEMYISEWKWFNSAIAVNGPYGLP